MHSSRTAVTGNAFFTHREYHTPEQLRLRLEKECNNRTFSHAFDIMETNRGELGPIQLRHLVGNYVESHWNQLNLPKYANQPENKEFLADKLFSVLNNPNISSEDKNEICLTIIRNFEQLFSTFDKRIQSDLSENRSLQRQFDVDESYAPSRVIVLGDETHNKGQVPLRIELENRYGHRVNIVYKPRSMLAEAAVCGLKGLFSQLNCGLPTYRVVDVERQYGYCELLENKPEENTFHAKSEVEDYMRSIVFLDKFARKLGLNDLHRNNIITSMLRPCPIDMETILQPTNNNQFDTALLNGFQAGYMFDIAEGTKNRVWFPGEDVETLLSEKKYELLTDESFDRVVEKCSGEIRGCRKILYEQRHRMVLIPTDNLKAQLKEGYKAGFQNFTKDLEKGLKGWGFQENPDVNMKDVEERFREDFMNNDVPVFYFDPDTNIVWYHDIPLGRQMG